MKPDAHIPPAHVPTAEYNREHPLLANPGETRIMQHLPQLDGVRAIAVLLVLWWHFMPSEFAMGKPVAPWGAIGVGLFFTLSGFLITRILLNCKLKIEAGRSGVGGMMRQFYVRRALRIFPLYYGVLLALVIINPTNLNSRVPIEPGDRVQVFVGDQPVEGRVRELNRRIAIVETSDGQVLERHTSDVAVKRDVRDRALWHAFYLSNVRFSYWADRTAPERHLWSLSVEEQFYLVWPLLMFLTPRRLLAPLIIATIVSAPLWRYFTYEPGYLAHEWMMPGCLDLLGGGALLALLSLPQFGLAKAWDWLVGICGVIGVPLFFIFVTAMSLGVYSGRGIEERATIFGIETHLTTGGRTGWLNLGHVFGGHMTYPVTAIAAVWLIGMASRGFKGPLGWLLSCAPMVYVGRISYGLYVLHMFVPHVLDWIFPGFGFETTRNWTTLVIFTGVSVLAASISWYAFEAPINGLKKYFEYDPRKPTAPAGATA